MFVTRPSFYTFSVSMNMQLLVCSTNFDQLRTALPGDQGRVYHAIFFIEKNHRQRVTTITIPHVASYLFSPRGLRLDGYDQCAKAFLGRGAWG